MAKIVDGIDMAEVKADELKGMIKAFNESGLGTIKAGANPLGSAKAFVKAIENLDVKKQAKLPPKLAAYFNRIVKSEEELAGGAPAVEEEDEPPAPTKKDAPKVVPMKAPKPTKAVKTVAEQHGIKKSKRDPDKPTKKSIVVAMVSKAKGATLDEMGQAMTDAGLGDFERNKATAGLWVKKLDFKVTKNEKTGKFSKAE